MSNNGLHENGSAQRSEDDSLKKKNLTSKKTDPAFFALKAQHQESIGEGISPAYKPNLDFLEDELFDEDI